MLSAVRPDAKRYDRAYGAAPIPKPAQPVREPCHHAGHPGVAAQPFLQGQLNRTQRQLLPVTGFAAIALLLCGKLAPYKNSGGSGNRREQAGVRGAAHNQRLDRLRA